MLVKLLIQEALKFANLIAEEGEEATATQINTGVSLFNIMLREINLTSEEVALLSEESFNLTVGQPTLDLPNWTRLIKVQYLLGSTRFDVTLLNLNEFLDSSRIVTTNGIPYIAYPKRTETGIQLQIFFTPSQAYPVFVHGYKNLTEVTVDDTLTSREKFLQDYLLFRLAYDLQTYYQLRSTPYVLSRVNAFEKQLKKLRVRRRDIKSITLASSTASTYGIPGLNLGRGWRPY